MLCQWQRCDALQFFVLLSHLATRQLWASTQDRYLWIAALIVLLSRPRSILTRLRLSCSRLVLRRHAVARDLPELFVCARRRALLLSWATLWAFKVHFLI
jgi:hypothetical protein